MGVIGIETYNSGLVEVETSERRQVGAMLVLHDGNGHVWLIKDRAKIEETIGFKTPLFVVGAEDKWGVVAGGRQGNEGVKETLRRECWEETQGVVLPDDFEDNLELVSPHFFVVNQLNQDDEGVPLAINQFGVGVYGYKVGEEFKEELRRVDGACWVSAAELNGFYRQCLVDGVSEEVWGVRPQVLVAAAMFCGDLSEEKIKEMNKLSVDWAYSLAESYGIGVNNGVVGSGGGVADGLDDLTRQFLGVRGR